MDNKKLSNNQELDVQNNEISLEYKSKKEVAKSGLLGGFIGLAVIVPGVSGSTISIIFKLYEKLLFAIGNIFKQFKKCAKFLLPILIGALIGFAFGFFTIRELLNMIPFAVVSLFGGLMLGAFPAVTDEIKREKVSTKRIILFILGLVIPIVISVISMQLNGGTMSFDNLKFYHYILFVFIGFLVAITQLVPGLSATALLMAFGCFKPLMNSVSLSYWRANPQVIVLYLCLVIGFAIGLVSVSKLLTKIFNKHRTPTFFMIAGLSLGSIITMFYNSDILAVYKIWQTDSVLARDLIIGVALFVLGAILSYFLVQYERKKNKNKN